jgi:hypothetical protein
VLECISTDADQVRHEVRFRVMFNTTTFIRSNVLMLNRDEIDIMWDDTDRFPEGFRVEVCNPHCTQLIVYKLAGMGAAARRADRAIEWC